MLFQPDGFYYATEMMGNKWGRGRWAEPPLLLWPKGKGTIAERGWGVGGVRGLTGFSLCLRVNSDDAILWGRVMALVKMVSSPFFPFETQL